VSGIVVHLLAQVFVEDKAEDVIAEIVCVHFAAQGVGYFPELLFELLFFVFGHSLSNSLSTNENN
jgi:hypothetical protein